MTVFIPDMDGNFVEYINVCELDLAWLNITTYFIDPRTEKISFDPVYLNMTNCGFSIYDTNCLDFIAKATRQYIGDLFEGLVIKVPTSAMSLEVSNRGGTSGSSPEFLWNL